MKTLLAILMSFLVTEAPVLAIHGGYTLGGATGTQGTYAGVLVPTQDTVLTTGSSASDFGANSLGLFTLGIPATGIGSGQIYLFSNGEQLVGTIQALPDPTTTSGIVGIIQATGEIAVASVTDNFFGFAEQQNQVTGQASGGLTAVAVASTNSISAYGINLSGTANVTVTSSTTNATTGAQSFTPTDAIVFTVEGFQQSDYAAPTSTTTTTGG